MKKLALLLAGAILLGAAAPAYAADPVATLPEKANVTKENDTQTTDFVGTIAVSTLSVTIPTKVPFNLDPSTAADTPTSQITDPTNAVITNNSKVPVDVKITKVVVGEVGSGNTVKPSLLNADTDFGTKENYLMFAIKQREADDETIPVAFTKQEDWLVASDTAYRVLKSTAGIAANGGTATLRVFGKASDKGWKSEDVFTITPTFTVSLVTATKPVS